MVTCMKHDRSNSAPRFISDECAADSVLIGVLARKLCDPRTFMLNLRRNESAVLPQGCAERQYQLHCVSGSGCLSYFDTDERIDVQQGDVVQLAPSKTGLLNGAGAMTVRVIPAQCPVSP